MTTTSEAEQLLQFLIEIKIKAFYGKIIPLEVNQDDTILYLKEIIRRKENVLCLRQKLILNGNINLTDDKATLSDYNFTKNSTFHLKCEDVEITVNNLTENLFS